MKLSYIEKRGINSAEGSLSAAGGGMPTEYKVKYTDISIYCGISKNPHSK
jgi:hypothetical protein